MGREVKVADQIDVPPGDGRDAFKDFDGFEIFTYKMTGSRMDRPGWDQLMEYIRPGDTLVVAELSRMTRSLMHLLETVIYDNSGKTAEEVCKVVGVGRRIFFAYLAQQRDQASAALTAN